MVLKMPFILLTFIPSEESPGAKRRGERSGRLRILMTTIDIYPDFFFDQKWTDFIFSMARSVRASGADVYVSIHILTFF